MNERINAVVCVDRQNAIGFGGRLLYRIPADLRRFRRLTTGGAVLMGRRTLEALPGGLPLPGRRNLVVSSRPPQTFPAGVEVFPTPERALQAALAGEGFVWVIGGEAVYRALLPRCGAVFLTRVYDTAPKADTHFPALVGWREVPVGGVQESRGLRFRFSRCERDASAPGRG